jgi:hypothetical protein
MTSRLTVVTGPPGVDIGPAVAKLGTGLDDGFAVRVVRSDAPDTPHTSPDPFHARPVADDRVAQGPSRIGAVRLSVLPSAWQDPQTNLGVVWTGELDLGLTEDLHTLESLGLNPAHRVTVQLGGQLRQQPWRVSIPAPVEVGNVGVQARDAVLRAGGRVLVEAGDGQTFLQALATVGIAPWAKWIDHLDRWIVLDVLDGMTARDVVTIVGAAVDEFDGSSGAYSGIGSMSTLRVALMRAQHLIPGLAGRDYNVAADSGDAPYMDDGLALADLLDVVADRTGVEVHLLGTGVWTWIESGDRTS